MSKQNILIIDDEIDVIEVSKDILLDNGYNVFYSLNGKDGLKILMDKDIDIVLLDIMLPGMDGWEVIEIMRLNNKTKKIPVIMFTAKKDFKDKILGIQQGAIDYITKPFLPEELVGRIKRVLDV
ncbi:response regulator [bacterium]|nr:response regulator [bacterium]